MFDRYLIIENGKNVAKVNLKDIMYIERYLRKLRVVTAKEVYEYYEHLEKVLPILTSNFYPCLQGCYVNFDWVNAMREQRIIFENEQCIYLGRANFVKTRQAFKKYLINMLEINKNACNQNGNSV